MLLLLGTEEENLTIKGSQSQNKRPISITNISTNFISKDHAQYALLPLVIGLSVPITVGLGVAMYRDFGMSCQVIGFEKWLTTL